MARTGRPPVEGSSREKPVCARFTSTTRQRMDSARGESSRSDFIREAVEEKLQRDGR